MNLALNHGNNSIIISNCYFLFHSKLNASKSDSFLIGSILSPAWRKTVCWEYRQRERTDRFGWWKPVEGWGILVWKNDGHISRRAAVNQFPLGKLRWEKHQFRLNAVNTNCTIWRSLRSREISGSYFFFATGSDSGCVSRVFPEFLNRVSGTWYQTNVKSRRDEKYINRVIQVSFFVVTNYIATNYIILFLFLSSI